MRDINAKAYLAALACGRSRGCHVREKKREKESLRERERERWQEERVSLSRTQIF